MQTQSATSVSPSLATQHAEATKRLSELSKSRQEDGTASEEPEAAAAPETGNLSSGSASGSVVNVLDIEAHTRYSDAKLAAAEAKKAASEAEFAVGAAQFAFTLGEGKERAQDYVAFLEQTEAVPPTEINAEEAERVKKLLEADGRGVQFGEDGVYMALLDDNMYTFTRDGKATVHEARVPTTEDMRQSLLTSLNERLAQIQHVTGGRSQAELQNNIATAQTAFEAAQANADRLAAEAEKASQFRTLDITA
ncbi:MAG: hypothetical protein ABJJ37_16740 [Roseibium sp.]